MSFIRISRAFALVLCVCFLCVVSSLWHFTSHYIVLFIVSVYASISHSGLRKFDRIECHYGALTAFTELNCAQAKRFRCDFFAFLIFWPKRKHRNAIAAHISECPENAFDLRGPHEASNMNYVFFVCSFCLRFTFAPERHRLLQPANACIANHHTSHGAVEKLPPARSNNKTN